MSPPLTTCPGHEPALKAAASSQATAGSRCGTFSQAELTTQRMITDRYHSLGFRRDASLRSLPWSLKPGCNLPRPLEAVLVEVGPSVGQLLANGDGFLDRGERLFSLPQRAQPQ